MDKATLQKFGKWNELKKDLHDKSTRPYFKIREVWWASVGQNIGDEQYGKNEFFERPVLILTRFYSTLALVIPISSKLKEGNYYHSLNAEKVKGILILSQARVIDAKRLLRRIETINIDEYNKILNKYKKLI